MIVDALLDLLAWLVNSFASILPSHRLDTDGTNMAWEAMWGLNYFLPISEVTTMVLSAILMGPAMLTATLSLWLVGLIRGGVSRA